MLQTIRHLLELIRFSHTIFALPFALLAGVMAWRREAIDAHTLHARRALPEMVVPVDSSLDGLSGGILPIRWEELAGILLCMVAARSFAMAVNRLADRRLDAKNPRTQGRHLPAGILSVAQVATFAIVSAIAFVAATLLFRPNRLPLYLSLPVLAFLGGYSYAKRFTALAHFWLGAALALSPIAAWIAIRGEVVLHDPFDLLPAVVLGGAVLSWVAGFDIIYACQDYESDCAGGLHSVPVGLGVGGALRLAAVCHLATVVLLALLPLVYPPLGWIYWTGVCAVGALLAYEHAVVRPDDLSRVNLAFFHVNAIISLGLFVVGTLDLLVGGG